MTHNRIFIDYLYDIMSEQIDFFIKGYTSTEKTALGQAFGGMALSIFSYKKVPVESIKLKKVLVEKVFDMDMLTFEFEPEYYSKKGDAVSVCVLVDKNKHFRIFSIRLREDEPLKGLELCEEKLFKCEVIKTFNEFYYVKDHFRGLVYIYLDEGKVA